MIARRSLSLLLSVLTLSCALPPSTPPLPATARTIACCRRTTVQAILCWSKAPHFCIPMRIVLRVTVPDVLATEVREQLARRGVKVIAPEAVTAAIGNQTPRSPEEAADLAAHGQLEGSALYIDIRRWEADISPLHPQRIIVALEARLLDPATGRTVWTAQRPTHPVPTPGVASRWRAYMIAARKVAEELFASTTMEENTMQGRTPTSRRAEVPSTGARPPDDMQDNPVARQLLRTSARPGACRHIEERPDCAGTLRALGVWGLCRGSSYPYIPRTRACHLVDGEDLGRGLPERRYVLLRRPLEHRERPVVHGDDELRFEPLFVA